MKFNKNKIRQFAFQQTIQAQQTIALLISGLLLCLSCSFANAEGEAGIISLRGQGHFYVGIETTEPAPNGSVQIYNQMYVGFQLVAEPKHPYPIVLVHGGGQATNWISTPDGRDGWRDYFLAAGFDVYWVDRPGLGRSPTNINYGELREGPSTGIFSFLAQSDQWPGNPSDHTDPSILNTLASAAPGPYGGDRLAAKDLGILLDQIGPVILMTYSAGALSGWWAADDHPDKIAAIFAIEPSSSNITSGMRKGLTFVPPLDHEFEAIADPEDCKLQPVNNVSLLPAYRNIPVKLIGSELGLNHGFPCSVKAFQQAGVNAEHIYLPDLGIYGNGHMMIGELNNGEIAQALIEIMAKIK